MDMFLTRDNVMKWNLLAAATVTVAALVGCFIRWWDVPVLEFLRGFDCRFWHILGAVFDDKVWAVVVSVALIVFYIKISLKTKINFRNERNKISISAIFSDFWQKTRCTNVFLIFCSIFTAGAVTLLAKTFIGRARPILFEALNFTGFYPPSLDWVFNSMPSGHSAVSFAALVMIGMLAPRVKPVTWTLAILIGVSRVCVGAHWPSDVLLGAFMGMVVADVIKYLMCRR